MFQMLSSQGISFLIRLILARLLIPEYFGIVGMAIVFTSLFSTIGDLGLGAALIQLKQDRLQKIHLDTVFLLSLLFNGVVFLILTLVVAPFVAWFYEEPILSQIIPVLGIGICLSPLSIIHRILLTRDLHFKPLSIVAAIASIVAGTVAVTLALVGAGVWSLVAHSVISAFISVPLLWYMITWKPSFRFSRKALADILEFSIYDMLQRTLISLTQNIDYLLIGKLLDVKLLGLYTFAFTLTDIFRQQIMAILNKVMFPVYSQLQDDLPSIKKYYLLVIKYNILVIAPIMFLLIFFADPLIPWLFGSQWQPSIFLVRAMSLASIIHAIGGTNGSVLKGIGRVDLNLKLYLAKTVLITVPAFIIGINLYGINGAAIAVIIHKTATRLLFQHHLKKLVDVQERDIARAMKPACLGSIAMLPVFITFHFIVEINTWQILLFAIFLAIVSYLLIAVIFVKEEMAQILKLAQQYGRNN